MANLCEHCHHLDLAWLRRRKLLAPGTSSSINWTMAGRPSGSIRIEVGTDAVRLIYRTRSPGEDWQDMCEVVHFRETHTRFGGRRRWFACPRCGRACRVLFGGGRFLCRSCQGLQYQSQYESAWSRATSRAQKLRMRLHGSANLMEPFPPRPKHMHHRSYQRLRALDNWLMGVSTIGLVEYLGRDMPCPYTVPTGSCERGRTMSNGMWPPNGGKADVSPNMFLAPALGMIASEWRDFVGRRVKEDFDLMHRLTRSSTPSQMLGAYTDFWQKAAEDYGNEIATMSKLMTDAATRMTTTMQTAVRDATETR